MRSEWGGLTQNTVVVSRTFFTQEITQAFDELEDGNENALKVGFPMEPCECPEAPCCVVHYRKPIMKFCVWGTISRHRKKMRHYSGIAAHAGGV